MTRYRVVEKFVSINGEGPRAGQLAVFIRFQGCNLNCTYCDTAWANHAEVPCTLMNTEEICRYIKETGIHHVTLTGGEPLLHSDRRELIEAMSRDRELSVEIETNGSIDLSEISRIDNPPAFTMDYKLPGSGMEGKMLVSNFSWLTAKDTVKFVAGSRLDLDRAREIIDQYQLTSRCQVHISTVFGQIEWSEVVDYMKNHLMNNVVLQIQMHKVIWPSDQRGV